MTAYDLSRIKPGWSLSKLNAFDCPRRGALLHIERRKEPRSDRAIVGAVLSEVLAAWRVHWFAEGVNIAIAHAEPERVAARVAADEGATQEHIDQALELFYTAAAHMRADLLPERDRVAQWWVEERMAFDRDWRRIVFSREDARWWGTSDQRERTWWRCVPDVAWLDTDGTLHVRDDKAGGEPAQKTQLHSYSYCLAQLLKEPPARVEVAWNLIGQGRVTAPETLDPDDVGGFPQWVAAQVQRVQSITDWSPRRGPQCSWCGFKADCLLYTQVAHQMERAAELARALPEAITSPEQFDKAAMLYDVAQDYLAQVRRLLEAWLRDHGGSREIPGLGKVAKLQGDSIWQAPLGPAVAAMARAGVPRETILEHGTMSKGRAEAIIKKAFPTGGKGVTKEVRAAHYAKRAEVMEAVLAVGEERPRKASLRIVQKEGA